MEELTESLLRPLARAILALCRFLSFLIWDLCVERVAWTVGWFIIRAITFGAFPKCGLGDYEAATLPTKILCVSVGAIVPIAAVGYLASYVSI